MRLIKHEGITFADQVIPLEGHAYINCRFTRCTMHMTGAPRSTVINGCGFEACVWSLGMVVSDFEQWDAFLDVVAPLIRASLPRTPDDRGPEQRHELSEG